MSRHASSKLSGVTRHAISVGVSLATAICLCMIISCILTSSEDPTKNLSLYGNSVFVISMFLCGFVGSKLATESRFLSGMLSSMLHLIIIVTASIVLGGSDFMRELTLALIGVGAALLGSLVGAKEKKRKRKH